MAEQTLNPADFVAVADSTTVAVADSTAVAVADSVNFTVADNAVTVVVPTWRDGLLPVHRPESSASPVFTPVIVVIMLAMCLSFRTIGRIWGTLIKRLWTTRAREGFDTLTISENRTVGMLIIFAVFFISLIASAGLSTYNFPEINFSIATTLRLMAIVGAYFVFQYAIYSVIGFAFLRSEERIIWVQGFSAAMSLLGIMLIIPALVILFYPTLVGYALVLAAVLYLTARMMFISKGFRIFYTNFASLVYFILYLCSLEIVPLVILYYCALKT